MSAILDPIESAVNSLLSPLTKKASTSSQTVKAVVVTSSAAASGTDSVTATSTQTSSSAQARSKTRSITATTETTTSSDDSTTTDSTSTETSTTENSTSTSMSTTFSTLTSTTSSTTSAVPSNPLNTQNNPLPASTAPASQNSGGISTAGIAVAIVMGVAVLAAISFFIFRFCPPVQRRYQKWKMARWKVRTYREALDGPYESYHYHEEDVLTAPRGSVAGKTWLSRKSRFHQLSQESGSSSPSDKAGLGLGRLSNLHDQSNVNHNLTTMKPVNLAETHNAGGSVYEPVRSSRIGVAMTIQKPRPGKTVERELPALPSNSRL